MNNYRFYKIPEVGRRFIKRNIGKLKRKYSGVFHEDFPRTKNTELENMFWIRVLTKPLARIAKAGFLEKRVKKIRFFPYLKSHFDKFQLIRLMYYE